jgi:hypothetical protein
MSFYLGVWNSPTAISDDEAAARYLVLSKERSVEPEFDERVYAFYCGLTGLYPEVEMVPEAELDACPWASGLDLSGDHVIMAIQPEKSEKVIPQVLALAEQLELVCFDPQAGKVYLPPNLRAEPVAAAAGAACASGSQPTPMQLHAAPESGGGEGPQPDPSCGVLSEQESVTNEPQHHLGTAMPGLVRHSPGQDSSETGPSLSLPSMAAQQDRTGMSREGRIGNTVFISWSGERSRLVAEALRGWLPFVLQTVKPWMSVTDEEKGSRWESEISARLEETEVGIICLTPENLNSPWLLFEAGALSKKLSESRVCTYLLDLTPAEVRPPMGMFQHTVIARDETRKLLDTINNAQANPVVKAVLDASFDKFWPELDEKIKAIPPAQEAAKPVRDLNDMVEELLVITRGLPALLKVQFGILERQRRAGQLDPLVPEEDSEAIAPHSPPHSPETDSHPSASPKAKLIKQLARLSAGIGSRVRA